jgi:K+-sensing histidine kinase KdpD
VEVLDEGPGVHSDHQGDIFLRFVNQDGSEEQARMGAGLGLSVVKAIIEAHRGQVGVENRPGGGSVFWFSLPGEKE